MPVPNAQCKERSSDAPANVLVFPLSFRAAHFSAIVFGHRHIDVNQAIGRATAATHAYRMFRVHRAHGTFCNSSEGSPFTNVVFMGLKFIFAGNKRPVGVFFDRRQNLCRNFSASSRLRFISTAKLTRFFALMFFSQNTAEVIL
jgi:hypothetical protein